jgi:hypothetical protein
MTKQPNKEDERRLMLRKQLWGNVTDEQLWSTKRNGWCHMPRTMPLIMGLLDELSDKGSPLSGTYLELWCQCKSAGVVEIDKPWEFAHAAGFTTIKNGERLWKARMLKLEELGFIQIAPIGNQVIGAVLIANPHLVLFQHQHRFREEKAKGTYNALLARMAKIRATELKVKDAVAVKTEPPVDARVNALFTDLVSSRATR